MKYPKLDFNDFADFEKKNHHNGVLTLQLSNWEEFHNVTQKFKGYTDYFWRGQRCYCDGWKLKSSFDRKFPNIKNRPKGLEKIFKNFKTKLADLSNSISINLTKDEIWAIGQHYGLPTPLLDWTKCPYIAAYFAFFKAGTKCQTKYRVIYALNRAVQRIKGKERFVKFLDLDQTHDKTQNGRLKEQKGRFTRALKGDNIEKYVKKLVEKRPCYEKKVLLAEILIPNNARDECMSCLRSIKITHGTMFPDYSGAVEICKMDLKIDNF